ncbi:MAG: hypothetical protein HYZ18_01070 [Pseudogulbenkiania sp.]|nr:hypothetical protein [Pseudogulbenkiania sp.]
MIEGMGRGGVAMGRAADGSTELGLKNTKTYSMIDKNELSPPIKIGAASRWAESRVAEWIANRPKATIMIFGMLSCVLFRSIPASSAAEQDKIPD